MPQCWRHGLGKKKKFFRTTLISTFPKACRILVGKKKILVLAFNFVFGDINMKLSIFALFCPVVFCPVKITCRDDPSKRGAERTCPRVISRPAPPLPTVSISASEDAWREVYCIRHASKGPFWICSSSRGRERLNLFEVFIVLIFFFFYLASLRISPAFGFAHFLWFFYSFEQHWSSQAEYLPWNSNECVAQKQTLSLLSVIICSIPSPSTHILKVKVNVFVTFKHIPNVNRRL